MFGAIEDDTSIAPVIGKTRKSLREVANIMFGQDPDKAPSKCGNAGNDAFVGDPAHSVLLMWLTDLVLLAGLP